MLFRRFADRAGLSMEGRDFLVANLDPMHDHLLTDLKGWPDVESAPSVVRCFKQSLQITNEIEGHPNWDCLINNWPMIQNYQAQFYNRNVAPVGGNNSISSITDPANPAFIGGTTVYEVPTGEDFTIGSGDCLFAGMLDSSTLGLGQEPGRIIGMGIEVINNTAPINAQGTVTVWRQPLPHSEPSLYQMPDVTGLGGAYRQQAVNGTLYPNPPLNLGKAMLLAGSRQWKATEGAYIVIAALGQDNPPLVTSYVQPFFIQGLLDTDTDVVNATNLLGPQAIIGGTTTTNTIWEGVRLNPVHQGGIYFTGLSPTSSLTLNVNTYYETFPSVYSDLVTLARPSCVYDPCALEMLSRVLSDLSVGVPAGENWDGEWWADVVEKISSFLPAIGAGLGGVPGGALGTALGGAGASLGSYLRAQGDTAGSKGKQKKVKKVKGPPPVPSRKNDTYRAQNQAIIQERQARKRLARNAQRRARRKVQ